MRVVDRVEREKKIFLQDSVRNMESGTVFTTSGRTYMKVCKDGVNELKSQTIVDLGTGILIEVFNNGFTVNDLSFAKDPVMHVTWSKEDVK